MEVKKYLPVANKIIMIQYIINNSIEERDGLKIINYIDFDTSVNLALLSYCVDIDNDNFDYEQLCETGELEEIINQIPSSEVEFIRNNALKMCQQECDVYNSIGAVLNRNLTKLIDKLPDEKSMKKIIDSIPKTLNKIDKERLDVIVSALGKKSGE